MTSRLGAGIGLLGAVLVINGVIALIMTGTADDGRLNNCTTADNITTCQERSETDFLATLFAVAVTGIEGAPFEFNVFYFIVMDLMLAGGILLTVWGLLPFMGA